VLRLIAVHLLYVISMLYQHMSDDHQSIIQQDEHMPITFDQWSEHVGRSLEKRCVVIRETMYLRCAYAERSCG